MEKAIWDWIAIQRRVGRLVPDEDVADLIERVRAAEREAAPARDE